MKSDEVILLYDYERQLPVALFEKVGELAAYIGRTRAVTCSGICRFKNGTHKFITDKQSGINNIGYLNMIERY